MKRLLILLLAGIAFPLYSQTVGISFDPSSPQQIFISSRIEKALLQNGYSFKSPGDWQIRMQLDTVGLEKESFSIKAEGRKILIAGGSGRALVYGGLELIESLRNGVRLENTKPERETARLPFRAIKYDLPWDTYRHSTALDQHQQTCSDVKYWEAFLDMMAGNRFNVLSLWNLHPYTFMFKPKNFPEASPWTDDEMKKWKTLFGSIFKMAAERGIETYIIPFNIFVTPEFSKAHNVAMNNLDHHFFVNGDTSEIVSRYTRECVTQMLDEYPEIAGLGLTLGEGMGGMTPQQREDWMKKTIIAGMKQAKRKSKLIHRIPFSSNTGSLGPTSIETEKLTRIGIEQEAAMDFIVDPVWADLKFNWSHPISTTKLVKVHGGKLFGAYFSPEPTSYKVIWTARNEDFFCLRWGVPGFIRDHIKANSPGYVGGYMIGSETYIPAKDYFTKPGTKVDWKYAFERQWLFYKIWGRLLYNTDTSDDVFTAEFVRRYGKQAAPMLEAYALAGQTPIRLAASFDFTWDFSLYAEGFLALDPKVKRVDYISVDRQINQPTLDPDYVSVVDFVEQKGNFGRGKITPNITSQLLDNECTKALDLIRNINANNDASLAQEIADIKVWATLGLYFSEKLRGAVALHTYRLKGGESNKTAAVNHLQKALGYWDEVVQITTPLYNEMPLVHYSEQDGKSWKENDRLRFHWTLIRPDVAHDVDIARSATH